MLQIRYANAYWCIRHKNIWFSYI